MNRDIGHLDFSPEDPKTIVALEEAEKSDYRNLLIGADLFLDGRPIESDELEYLIKCTTLEDRRLGLAHPIFSRRSSE